MLQLNYERDVESGEFVPSKEYKPLFHYDEGENLAFIEWLDRELMFKTDEARQRYHERYDENFDDMDVCEDEYVCHIPDEFLSKEEGLSCVESQYNLGVMYNNGLGVPVDYVAARRWFSKAAEQGLAESQYNLGKIYHLGKGVPVDFEKARKWYTKALEQGYEDAKEGLSRLGDVKRNNQ